MNTILFNTGWKWTKGGQSMEVKPLTSFDGDPNIDKDKLPYLQMFNNGKRVTSDNVDWESWNGCTYVDIDSKHYYNNVRPFAVEKLYKGLYNFLINNFQDNFYAMQLSNSGTSFHFVFYFNVTKNELNFNKCNQYASNAVKSAFYVLGPDAKQIYNYPKVADRCTRSPYQGMFITIHPFTFNENMDEVNFGSFDVDTYELEETRIYSASDIKENGEKLFNLYEFKQIDGQLPYKEHLVRMQIYTALIGVFGDKATVDREWTNNIVPFLSEGNGHDKWFFANEPNKNGWYDYYDPQFVHIGMLEEFGYSFTKIFEPHKIDLYNADVVYELKENEHLSDIKIDWSFDKINHLYAGCSLGKTYNAKDIGFVRDIDDMDWIFGERNKRVCFISPMRSINKDSFTNEDNWVIIDSDHKEENEDKYVSVRNALNGSLNICTTWESFVLYNMYAVNFDFIIVDEIHTLYMYDYRIKSITQLKEKLQLAQGIKIVMTGTPSAEVYEFKECKKIKIIKELPKVNCDLVFYNNSFQGYYLEDIEKWTQDPDHYVLLFYDRTNSVTEETFRQYGLTCDIFNSNYTDNVDYILNNHNVKSQITAFSVYGQAGINLYIDTNKKVRIYILNNNALGIIQYANRMRNREQIDKIIIGYKTSKVNNSINELNMRVDFDEVQHKIDILNKVQHKVNIFDTKTKDVIKPKYGLNIDYLDKINDQWMLNERHYHTYGLIQNVNDYETQIQIIYNRLIENYYDVHFTYLPNDIKTKKATKFRNNQLAGQFLDFDWSMVKQNKNGMYWIEPTKQFKKICVGDLIDTTEKIINYIAEDARKETGSEVVYEETHKRFTQYIDKLIAETKAIRKTDLSRLARFLEIKHDWETYYNNGFVTAMLDERWDLEKLTAAYIRSIYKDELKADLESICKNIYDDIKELQTVVRMYAEVLGELKADKMNIVYDETTQMIYNIITEQHGKGKNHGHKIMVEGIVYKSVKEAAEATGHTRPWVYAHMKEI